jgi:shikimate dehydrogenase
MRSWLNSPSQDRANKTAFTCVNKRRSRMSLSGKAKVAGVMGWPVSHSLSPRLHGFWLQRAGVDGTYIPLPVPPERITEAIRALPALGFRGANVTVPHKEAALAAADRATERAQRMGAANTLIVEDDGSITADNTDGFGFVENLRQGAAGWTPEAGPAVVLGAGGAARGVIGALLAAGTPEVIVLNRTRSRAEALAADLQGHFPQQLITVADWDARASLLSRAAVLVNTTTQGMKGNPPLELDLSALPVSAVVTDIVYVPLQTDLLTRAAARGNPVVDGLGMLLHQARPGFEAWFGLVPEVDEALRAHMLTFVGR